MPAAALPRGDEYRREIIWQDIQEQSVVYVAAAVRSYC
jgi:hypothetical protein